MADGWSCNPPPRPVSRRMNFIPQSGKIHGRGKENRKLENGKGKMEKTNDKEEWNGLGFKTCGERIKKVREKI
jgi:hypothetical protein